jgi:hypothetical protein
MSNQIVYPGCGKHGGGYHPACNACRAAMQNVYQAVRGLKRPSARACPCGSPGASPCWRVGGEAACASIVDPSPAHVSDS